MLLLFALSFRWPKEDKIEYELSQELKHKCCGDHICNDSKNCNLCQSKQHMNCRKLRVAVKAAQHHRLFLNYQVLCYVITCFKYHLICICYPYFKNTE